MKKNIIFICCCFLLFPLLSFAQKKTIKNNNTTYNFSEVWVWEFSHNNENKREMAIYREPNLNYWLLTPDDANFRDTDEMSLWFIVKPNGEVIQAYQDAEDNDNIKLITHRLDPENKIRIPHYWKSTGKTKTFGSLDLGFEQFSGKEYKIQYEKINDQSVSYLGVTTADFGTISLFNNLNIDAKLPIRFPQDIPRKLVPLSENTTFTGGSVQYEFKYISPTVYYINLSDFKSSK